MSEARRIPSTWTNAPLAKLVKARSGNSKIIKGKQANSPSDGLVQGYSASGPDIWVREKEYSGPGIVVSAVGARCGKTFLAEGDWTAIANTHAIVPCAEVDPRFLWYLTNREEWWIKSGTAQPFVKVKATLERNQPLPPIEEQWRIVEILDEQLSRLDAALESVRVVREKAAQFRRSLLHAAFNGQLTRTSGSSPRAGWTESTLNELVDSKSDIIDGPFGSNLKSAHYTESGARVIRLQNIGFGEYIDADAFISMERFKGLVKHNAREGDLLFASLGENLPRTALVPDLQGPAIVKADCIRVRLSESINRKYVLYATQRPDARKWATDQLHGMGRPRLGLGAIRDFPVPIAPVGEQEAVVMLLEDQFSRVEAALRIANGLESRASAERRSLLHAAFTGELTASWRNSR